MRLCCRDTSRSVGAGRATGGGVAKSQLLMQLYGLRTGPHLGVLVGEEAGDKTC